MNYNDVDDVVDDVVDDGFIQADCTAQVVFHEDFSIQEIASEMRFSLSSGILFTRSKINLKIKINRFFSPIHILKDQRFETFCSF